MPKATIKQDETFEILNELIGTCRDAEKGFADAANHIENPAIRSFLEEQSRTRARFAQQLQQQVRELGGFPEEQGSTGGAVRRAWMDLKSALGGGDKAILSSSEAGEDSAVAQYRWALEKLLPESVRSVVALQYESIERTHERIRTLRDSA
jgi:uncharacterized protein (TIGR02284 family)